ncbi:MAG: DNA cytosine methyltransferase [Bdellovibrionales bacterium]
MNVLDLFSGIGGFSLGLEAAGMRTAAFCEIEPYCRAVLRRHWPDVPIHEDVRALDGRPYRGAVELICGGYPCQPFSMAGRRRGEEDERHLWPEMYRLIREIRPRWVVAENVAGHISLGFDEVAASLEAEGFTVWPFIIPACAVGAPHRRDRVWIIAHAARAGERRETGSLCQAHGRQVDELPRQSDLAIARYASDSARGETIGQERRRILEDAFGSPAADASDKRCERSFDQTVQGQSKIARKLARGLKRWADGWPVSAPRLCRVDDGIPHRTQRLRALGNAVVPQIPYLIGRAILRHERGW